MEIHNCEFDNYDFTNFLKIANKLPNKLCSLKHYFHQQLTIILNSTVTFNHSREIIVIYKIFKEIFISLPHFTDIH